jgi:MFS family permease
VVTGEIYPTQVRSTGVGWGLTAGRFGAACGPLLGGLLQSAGVSFNHYFAIFAIPGFLSALLTLFYRINVKGEDLETVTVKLATTSE